MTIRCYNRVALLLTLLLLAVTALPFVTYAPNRLLSGEARWLWTQMPWLAAVQLAGALLLLLLCWIPCRLALLGSLLIADLLLPLLMWGAGDIALQLVQQGSPLARTSPGSGLWLSLALCLLLASDTIRRLTPHALWRWLLNAQLWLLPCLLLWHGSLDQLSLLKEYANREDVFNDALRQHLWLLFGTLLPGLLLGLSIGFALWRRPHWQAPVFTFLNVIQTIPSVALFGLLIAPLAGLTRHFPLLGKIGISGTGLPGANRTGAVCVIAAGTRGGDRAATGTTRGAGKRNRNGNERLPAFSPGSVTVGAAGPVAQPAGGQRTDCRYGGGSGVDRRGRLRRFGVSGAAQQRAGFGAVGCHSDDCVGGSRGCRVCTVERVTKRRNA